MAAQKLDLKNGEEVDFVRAPSTKDASGWCGPAVVIDVYRVARGIITIRYQNPAMEVRTKTFGGIFTFHLSERLSCRTDSQRSCLGFRTIIY
jgi:hypothetical protein